MTATSIPLGKAPLQKLRPAAQWGLLLAGSAVFAGLFEIAGLPAARLLGPLVAGILVGANGGTVRVPRLPYIGSQAIIGCLIAGAISPKIIVAFLQEWPLFLGVALAVIAASSLLGWLISLLGVLPGTTAVWGSSPGAASAMMLMAEAFGADVRLVAFMQYLRVAFVALTASLVARLWMDLPAAAAPATAVFAPIHWLQFVETLTIAGFAAVLGRMLRWPAGPMLLSMIAGSVLHASGLLATELPQWLLAASYALLGWNIGLGFTRRILAHASRALPQIVLSTLALIAFCGGLGYLLTKTVGVDPLTAYLATSPGGMDSVAIIAASSKVDISFVMALQTVRFVIVLVLGPPLARFIAGRTAHRSLSLRP
ncbi:MAG: AbrB family transcriptional regulator [Hyphomicrobiales bacterium]